jgi:hypothetical protein
VERVGDGGSFGVRRTNNVSASQPGRFHHHAGGRSPGHRSIGGMFAVTGENDSDGSPDI